MLSTLTYPKTKTELGNCQQLREAAQFITWSECTVAEHKCDAIHAQDTQCVTPLANCKHVMPLADMACATVLTTQKRTPRCTNTLRALNAFVPSAGRS